MSFVHQTQDHYEKYFKLEQNTLCGSVVQLKTHRNSEHCFVPRKIIPLKPLIRKELKLWVRETYFF